LRILMIADIVGRPGREIVYLLLGELREKYKPHFIIANAENAAGGLGLTAPIAKDLLASGIDIITLGNHTWDKKDLIEFMEIERRIIRPLNYPPGSPGKGSIVLEKEGMKLAVISLLGRVFINEGDCPFRAVDEELKKLEGENLVKIVDMHAEASSEKKAMGYFLDGRVSAVIGTHTHISTTDFQILPAGTAYVTDIGMTGPVDSVIGIKKELIIQRFLTQLPVRFEVAGGKAQIEGAFIEIGDDGKAIAIQRILETD